MEQLWLVLSLLSLVTGFGLVVALLVLKRLAPLTLPPVIAVVFALLAIGFAIFFGVYLSLVDIPRNVIAYKVINAAAWGVPAWALVWFVLWDTAVRRGTLTHHAARNISVVTGVLVVLAAWFTVNPRTVAAAMIPPMARTVAILAVASGITGLALVVAVLSLKRSKTTASRPWRAFFRGFGLAFLVLFPIQMVDLTLGVLAPVMDFQWKDGFAFAVAYGAANVILIFAIIGGLRLTTAGGESTSVPGTFVDSYGITPRERDVLEGLISGKTYRAIAELLYISPRTVETHVQTIFRKCNVNSRAQMVHLVASFEALRSG
ncbi:MAG: helix-turn-helix transcriptional regulator [Spirochaeta sp.]|jgi:DNA-binding CsgD family transcriptional regulator|nr:helix-turn-helix transcriptional regulator [Spirochaeta sp.]